MTRIALIFLFFFCGLCRSFNCFFNTMIVLSHSVDSDYRCGVFLANSVQGLRYSCGG